MKTLTKRMVSIMLVIVLVFSFITPAFAVDGAEPSPDIVANETGTLDEIQAARKAYFLRN